MTANDDLAAARRDWIERRLNSEHIDPHGQLGRVIDQVADRVLAHCRSVGEDRDALITKLFYALNVVTTAKWVLTPVPDENERTAGERKLSDEMWEAKRKWLARLIWSRRDLDQLFRRGTVSREAKPIDKRSLVSIVAKYLERPWMENGFLEWAFVDALVSEETRAFGEHIKGLDPKTGGFSFAATMAYMQAEGDIQKIYWRRLRNSLVSTAVKLAFAVVLPVAALWWEWTRGDQQWAAWGTIGYAALVVLSIARALGRRVIRLLRPAKPSYTELLELYAEMARVYRQLEGPVINPSMLRDALHKSQEKGAVWDVSVFSLIDRIVARDPSVWTISEDLVQYWPLRQSS